MTYRDTARAFVRAEQSTRSGAAPDPATLAADRLPISDWAESRRATMTPQTIAANHAAHVSDTAHALREALETAVEMGHAETGQPMRYPLKDAARALLAAIGEGEGA